MKLPRPYRLEEIAELLQCDFTGPADHTVTGINEIHRVEAGDLVFVDHPKYYDKALNSAATTILIDKDVPCPEDKGLLVSKSPFRDFNHLTKTFRPPTRWGSQIDQTAKVAESSEIRPGAVIGPNVEIGENCVIHANVVIYDYCVIGNDVTIHANSVIGADAFYYKKQPDGYNRMHTCGSVVIEDRVEIGAQCAIDRGVSAETVIGAGSKIDNLVHIGHDCIIGKNCLIAAQVGIAGCTNLEDGVTIWGQAGLASDLTIGKNTTILAQSGIMGDLAPDKTYFGSPAIEARAKFREIALTRKLDHLFKTKEE